MAKATKSVGRPPTFSDPAKMQKLIDNYFKRCKRGRKVTVIRKGKPVEMHQKIPKTVAGLALALGFSSRQSLLNYQGKAEFVDIIARAKLQIERDNIEGGMMGEYESKLTSLNLASNYGYNNRQEIDTCGGLIVQVVSYAGDSEQKWINGQDVPQLSLNSLGNNDN